MIKKNAEEVSNILPFVKPSQKDGNTNWLLDMKPGTVFWGKPKHTGTFVVDEFLRGSNIDEFVLVVQNMPVGQPHQYWVDSSIFSKTVSLLKIRSDDDEGSVS